MNDLAITVLQNSDLLRHLDAASMARVAPMLVRRHYEKGKSIFSEGEPGDGIFGVIAGCVHVSASRSGDLQVFLHVIGAGGVFGVVEAIDGLERCTSAIAATNVDAFRISREALMRLVTADPQVMLGLFQLLCQYQRRATTRIINEYSQHDVLARLATRILSLTEENGRAGQPDSVLHIKQEDLANFVCASRQIVNLHLNEWARLGWVLLSRRRLDVIDRGRLAEIASGLGGGAGNGAGRIGIIGNLDCASPARGCPIQRNCQIAQSSAA